MGNKLTELHSMGMRFRGLWNLRDILCDALDFGRAIVWKCVADGHVRVHQDIAPQVIHQAGLAI